VSASIQQISAKLIKVKAGDIVTWSLHKSKSWGYGIHVKVKVKVKAISIKH